MRPSPSWHAAVAMRLPTNKAIELRPRQNAGLPDQFQGRPAVKPFIAGRLGNPLLSFIIKALVVTDLCFILWLLS
jgi:hypothetical protein